MTDNIKTEEIINILKKRWKLILIFTLTFTLISSLITFFLIKPQYEARTKLFIGKDEAVTKNEFYDNNEILMYQKLLKTYATIIKTKDLAETAIEDTNININSQQLLSNLTIIPVSDTQVLEIKLKSKSPKEASNLLTSITEQFIVLSKEIVPNGNVQILEMVQASKTPISPNKRMNIAVAVLIGLISGIAVVIFLEFMDNTFKSKEDLERELQISVIGVIPNME